MMTFPNFRCGKLAFWILALCSANLCFAMPPSNTSRLRSNLPLTYLSHAQGTAFTSTGESELNAEELLEAGRRFKAPVTITTLTGVGFITAWGVWKWDYFTRSPHTQSEGWFGYNTSSGGADKLGHFYSSYVASHAFSWFYESNGMPRRNAAVYGAFTSFVIMGYMEFGDSFSSYGFSYEDMIANTLGCLSGYFMYNHPELSKRVDVRIEIGLHPESSDVITDYDNTKFLLAFKLNGFETTRRSFLKYFEVHMGYYTRGYETNEVDRDRNLFVGIGLNLTDLIRGQGYKRTATIFNYLQVPYTSVNYRHEVN